MAEINKYDIISKEALDSIKEFTGYIDDAAISVKALADSGKSIGVNLKGAESTKAVREETEKLSAAQIELAKIEKQIETATARNTAAYREKLKALNDEKAATKDAAVLGSKNAQAINEQNASLNQLKLALDKNRKAYSDLANEEARSSKEGQALKTVIDQQDASVKKLNGSIGNFTGNVGNYDGAIQKLKEDLKAARGEMVSIGETLGQSSKEYQAAAKRAGEIGDKIADAKDEAKAFQGDTSIENLGTRFGLLGDKVKALDFKGAATQIKGIAELAKGMTFKEAISGLGGFGSALASLGKALLTNPIFLIGAAIAAAVVAFNYFQSEAEKLTQSTIDRLDREEKAIQSRYDLEISLLRIAHKETTNKEIEAQEEFIKNQKEKIKALTEISDWQYILATNFLINEKKFNAERKKEVDKLKDGIKKSEDEITKLRAENVQKIIDHAKTVRERVFEIMKAADADEAKEEAERLKNWIETEDKKIDHSAELLAEIFAETNNALKKQADEEFKINEDKNKKLIESDEYVHAYRQESLKRKIEELQKYYSFYEKLSGAILDISSNATTQRIQDIDSEINKNKEKAAQEILLVGGNLEEKAKIEAKYNLQNQELEKKKKAELRKQAELDRANDIIKATIMGIQATLKGLVEGGPFLAALYAGLAAAQIAALISKPLPQYAEGTGPLGTTSPFVIAGEEGSELYRTPSGVIGLTPSSATVMSLPMGTQIIPHEETMKALSMKSLGQVDSITADYSLYQKMDSLEKTIKKGNKEFVKAVIESAPDVIRQGSILMKVKKSVDGSRTLTRSKSMGL